MSVGGPLVLAGLPIHLGESSFARMSKLGESVANCEQVGEFATGNGSSN